MISGQVLKKASIGDPELSVIIPVYNSVQWIRDALLSVLGQQGLRFEVIVADDGSTDNSLAMIQAAADERCTVLRMESNRGVAHVRNEAIKQARAKWICPFDADDIMLPNRLNPYFRWVQGRNGAVWANCGLLIANDDGTPRNHAMGQPFDDVGMLGANVVNHGMSLIRRDAMIEVGGYESGVPRGIDYTMMLKMALLAPPVFHNEIGYLYRMHERSISHTKECPLPRIMQNYRLWLEARVEDGGEHAVRASMLLRILDLHEAIRNERWADAAHAGDTLFADGLDTFELRKLTVIARLRAGRLEQANELLRAWLAMPHDMPAKGPAAHRAFVEKVWLADQALRVVSVTGNTALKSSALNLARHLQQMHPVRPLAALIERVERTR
jgi:glycosyltransferase involved in cell wall biosynthesis